MKKGEIWLTEFPAIMGHEQTGNRPAIILTDTDFEITIIIPITSNIQALRFPYTLEIKPSKSNGLKINSIALVFQIRAIDKKRLIKKIGMAENSIMRHIDEIIKKLFEL